MKPDLQHRERIKAPWLQFGGLGWFHAAPLKASAFHLKVSSEPEPTRLSVSPIRKHSTSNADLPDKNRRYVSVLTPPSTQVTSSMVKTKPNVSSIPECTAGMSTVTYRSGTKKKKLNGGGASEETRLFYSSACHTDVFHHQNSKDQTQPFPAHVLTFTGQRSQRSEVTPRSFRRSANGEVEKIFFRS